MVKDRAIHNTITRLDTFEFPPEKRLEAENALRNGMSIQDAINKYGGHIGTSIKEGNLLLNEGINALWNLLAGQGAETNYGNANARVGVGNSAAAVVATQTALQGASTAFVAMDATFPTTGSSQQAVFRGTFGTGVANFAWEEYTVDNGVTPNKNLNRVLSAEGTKTSNQTRVLTITITLS